MDTRSILILISVYFIAQLTILGVIWGLWIVSRSNLLLPIREKFWSHFHQSQNAGNRNAVLLDTRLSTVEPIDRFLRGFDTFRVFKTWLLQAGVSLKTDTVLVIAIVAGLVGFLVTRQLLHSPFLVAITSFSVFLIPFVFIEHRRRQRRLALEGQLPHALDSLARAMQAGHSFSVALRMVARDLDEPLSSEFLLAAEEINFGAPLRLGMERLAERVNTSDIRFFVAAVLIHMQTGGRLSELLSNLAGLIRERQKLVKTIKVLSAEGRLSAWILTGLPLVTGFVIYSLNPSFISILWTNPLGIFLIQITVAMMIVGLLWMAWIARPVL